MNPLTQSKYTTILPVLIALMLGCFGLSPQARAVCQEGCLTNSNTVLGEDALLFNTGFNNTALGFNALLNNTTGPSNTAVGTFALLSNTTGTGTAIGYGALLSNTTGFSNTATGAFALQSNTTGISNTATGQQALINNTTGSDNTANGQDALFNNRRGSFNTAVGFSALFNNTDGSNNIALGFYAGQNLKTGDYNIDIGNTGLRDETNTIRIGTNRRQTAAYIAGISGVAVAGGVGVIIDTDGHLGTIVSSERFKDEIKPMDNASEAIHALKPVTFRYKQELDPDGIPQFGLVAEDVEKVNPALVARDDQGKVYTVRYEAVNAMLLNEFLKEHRKVQEQEAAISQLKSIVAKQETTGAEQQREIKALAAMVKQQASQIQKVSAQLQLSKPAAETLVRLRDGILDVDLLW